MLLFLPKQVSHLITPGQAAETIFSTECLEKPEATVSLQEVQLQLSGPQAGGKSPHSRLASLRLFPMLHFSWGWERKERKAERAGGGRDGGETPGKDNGLCKIPLWAVWPSSMAAGHMNSKKNVAQEFLPNDSPCLSLWEFGAADTFLP